MSKAHEHLHTTHRTATGRSNHARIAANARWRGKTAEERSIERAKGRENAEPWPRCPCGMYTIGVAKGRRHKCEPKPETAEIEPSANAIEAHA